MQRLVKEVGTWIRSNKKEFGLMVGLICGCVMFWAGVIYDRFWEAKRIGISTLELMGGFATNLIESIFKILLVVAILNLQFQSHAFVMVPETVNGQERLVPSSEYVPIRLLSTQAQQLTLIPVNHNGCEIVVPIGDNSQLNSLTRVVVDDGSEYYVNTGTGEVYKSQWAQVCVRIALWGVTIAVMAGATYVGCKIRDGLNKVMEPHLRELTNETDNILNLAPPMPPNRIENQPANVQVVSQPSFYATIPTGSQIVYTNIEDNSFKESVANRGWQDWEGNLISTSMWLFVFQSNCVAVDTVGNVTPIRLQTSSNLASWQDDIVSAPVITRTWSSVSNAISISFYNYRPYQTNWYRINQQGSHIDYLPYATIGSMPIDGNVRQKFWRIVSQ